MRSQRLPTRARWILQTLVFLLIVAILAALMFPPMIYVGPVLHAKNAAVQDVRQLGTIFFAYASGRDDQEYPHAVTSTEIIKELLRSGDLTDTNVLVPMKTEEANWFWLTGKYQTVPMTKGKSRYEGKNPSADLSATNNDWAVTQISPTRGLTLSANDNTPLIFTCGTYKVVWPTKTGVGAALVPPPGMRQDGIVVYYTGNAARYLRRAPVDDASPTDLHFAGTTARFIAPEWTPGPVPYQVVQP